MQIRCGGIGGLALAFLYPHVETQTFIHSTLRNSKRKTLNGPTQPRYLLAFNTRGAFLLTLKEDHKPCRAQLLRQRT